MTKQSPPARARAIRGNGARTKDEVVSTVKRMLPVEIDSRLSDTKRKRIAKAVMERKVEREKMNQVTLVHRKAIKELDAEIEKLSGEVEKGTEEREVLCDVINDYKHNVVKVRRKDSGKVIEDRTMTAEDRQEDVEKYARGKAKAAPRKKRAVDGEGRAVDEASLEGDAPVDPGTEDEDPPDEPVIQ